MATACNILEHYVQSIVVRNFFSTILSLEECGAMKVMQAENKWFWKCNRLYIASHHSAAEHGFHRNPPSHSILGISFNLRPGLINSFGLFEHPSSTCIPWSPPALFALVIPLWGLPGYDVGWFLQCTAQPSPLAFPDQQIYSGLLCALPQLFICYLVWPEDSQYFP
jgi:hypothetical protein